MIPWTLFYALLDTIRHVSAAEQLQDYYAVLLGAGQVWSGPDGRAAISRSVRNLTQLAYPEAPK